MVELHKRGSHWYIWVLACCFFTISGALELIRFWGCPIFI